MILSQPFHSTFISSPSWKSINDMPAAQEQLSQKFPTHIYSKHTVLNKTWAYVISRSIPSKGEHWARDGGDAICLNKTSTPTLNNNLPYLISNLENVLNRKEKREETLCTLVDCMIANFSVFYFLLKWVKRNVYNSFSWGAKNIDHRLHFIYYRGRNNDPNRRKKTRQHQKSKGKITEAWEWWWEGERE